MFDDALIKKFNAGEALAFRELFDRYYLPVKSYAYHYVNDGEIAEDFVQDAFIGLWENRCSFSCFPAIKSFLHISVRNSCLNYLRHKQVQRRNERGLVSWLTEDCEQQFMLEEEVHSLVHRAIRNLSPQARRVIIMTMGQASNSEIAESLNVSVNTVKTIKLRAYRTLRERLESVYWLLIIFYIEVWRIF